MRGDHLTVHYTTFYHHGIDCGDGTVVHMSREHGGIVRSSYAEFADGRRVFTEPSPATYKRKAITRRAISRVGETGYHLFNNNCEHFVSWCRTGQMSCRQLKNVSKAFKRQSTKQAIKSGAHTVAHLGAKQVGKTGSKVLAKTGAKSSAKVVTKTLAKGGGAFIAVDLAQAGIEQFGGNMGLSQSESETLGRTVGAGGHIAVGAAVGGPVGAVVGAAIWGAGELFGGFFD